MIEELLRKPLPQMPEEIKTAPAITATSFEDKNVILTDDKLQREAGICEYGMGKWLVSMYCPMPGITPEMIEWWFWWHPQQSLRYQVWYPGAHHEISYRKKDEDYFKQEKYPGFRDNVQYPKESIGGQTATIEIDFVTPEEYGFSRKLMDENDIPLIICGHVGIKNFIKHTEMAHFFKKTNEGLYMFSRFWMGEGIKNGIVRSIAVNESVARGMEEHCCIEYRNLAAILPELYKEYAKV